MGLSKTRWVVYHVSRFVPMTRLPDRSEAFADLTPLTPRTRVDIAVILTLSDLQDCERFAIAMARCVETPMCLGLEGTLGAGKTQWTRFFAMALGADPAEISSPTFVLLHEYSSQPKIYHLDLYRIRDEDELLETGIEELFDQDAVTVVEWADRFARILPRDHIRVVWEFVPSESGEIRRVQLIPHGTRAVRVIERLKALSTVVWDHCPEP
jgi:tRNA threonylcarbamoyladenosine biosynthesis protein TsaE